MCTKIDCCMYERVSYIREKFMHIGGFFCLMFRVTYVLRRGYFFCRHICLFVRSAFVLSCAHPSPYGTGHLYTSKKQECWLRLEFSSGKACSTLILVYNCSRIYFPVHLGQAFLVMLIFGVGVLYYSKAAAEPERNMF